ncbi:metal-dependent hydrolase [Natronorarus salvus]|uniref:metal-dependent hydrolase n=1 Tax=Natronorarus salvus TaxID=3117733 RepID=UPI002F268B7B
MQPVVHLAVAYLSYAAYTRWRLDRAPTGAAALVAVLAAALPDLIDRPLYWAGLTPVGRTLAHSLLFAIPLIALVRFVTRRVDRSVLGVAFAIGYLSHVVTDVPWHVLAGDYHELGFLLWPVTSMPDYSGVKPLGTVGGLEVTTLWLEAPILVAGLALWIRDGAPGAGVVRDRIRR